MTTHRARIQGRLHAAQINGGAAAATPRGGDLYTVTGRTGTHYSVKVVDLDNIFCDCKAGQCGVPCWHSAAAFLRIIADRAGVTREARP